jgi:hypothetical protein
MVTATKAGDVNFQPITSSPAPITVEPAATMMALISNLNPSTYQQPVTFTATVSAVSPGAGAPSGTVSWSSNTGCAATPVSSGTAHCTTSSLQVGTDTITATYWRGKA